jgi:Putative Actinobacterial Holin-X, holin superfamily III
VVYRELLQLDRALRGGSLLLIEKTSTSEEKEMASENKLDVDRPALPSSGTRADHYELERMTNRQLLSHTMQTALDLVKKEVELAKVEVKADLQSEVSMAKGLGVAGLCAIWSVSLMLVACAFALATVLPGWAAALIVAAAVLAVGTIAGLVGWGKRVKKPLQTTLRTLKEDARWAKERMA